MKKMLLTFLLGTFALVSACANSSTGSGNTVVCYFSCTGNTRVLAETAAKVLNADLFEIIPQEPYTDADIDWHDSKSRSSIESNDSKSRPAIKTLKPVQGSNTAFDVSKYDTVVLAFPIWWNSAPKIMWNFVEQHDLSGKKVVAICTSGSSSISGAEKDLKARASKSAIWKSGTRFTASTGESELKKYFDTVLK